MKIALLQFNPILGDFTANAQAIVQAACKAKQDGAQILLVPSMFISGAPLASLSAQQSFLLQLNHALALIRQIDDLPVLFGHPQEKDGQLFQAASVYYHGQCLLNDCRWSLDGKSILVDEKVPVFTYQNKQFAVAMFPDLSNGVLPVADGLIVLDDTPYYAQRQQEQQEVLYSLSKEKQYPILLLRNNGAQDERVFGGASFAVSAQGELTFQGAFCQQEKMLMVNYQQQTFSGSLNPYPQEEEAIYRALVCSLQTYVKKCGFSRVCLGLSGGMDSALVLALAVDALGAQNCEVLLMPSQYTADLSNTSAEKMAKNLGVSYTFMPINPLFNAFQSALQPRFTGLPEDVTEENLQARIRGILLMALSNKTGAMLLSTGNKSEVAVGYATLYGDMNGGFAPLKDVLKTQVYAIARWLNQHRHGEIIPQEIIDRPPSAELRANQTDQDSLPEYDILDALIVAIVEKGQNAHSLIQAGFTSKDVQRTLKLLQINEYKRRQGVLGTKVSRSALGVDWQLPICQQYDFQ